MIGVSPMCPHRQDPEKGEQYVFSFTDPRDGFNMQRVPGKQGGYEKTFPGGPGHGPKNEKQQDTVNCMKKYICQMVTASIESKQFVVQQV